MTMTEIEKTNPGLFGLFAEMQALMGLMPVMPLKAPSGALPDAPEGRADQVAISEEDAVEAGFDNMPV
ncbi:hypothetical protein [Gemmobacter denitrificans]|uniref:Uncharacterized protein n=1 Tax=Gemmobacter denitrificans TaxID=3123040 RepID=A0ABU8BX05_9RHOB